MEDDRELDLAENDEGLHLADYDESNRSVPLIPSRRRRRPFLPRQSPSEDDTASADSHDLLPAREAPWPNPESDKPFWQHRTQFQRSTMIPHTLHWLTDETAPTAASLSASADRVLGDEWKKSTWNMMSVEAHILQLAAGAQLRLRAPPTSADEMHGAGHIKNTAADHLLVLLPRGFYQLAKRAAEQRLFARLVLLYLHGGVFVNADATILAPLDPLLDEVASANHLLVVGRSYDVTHADDEFQRRAEPFHEPDDDDDAIPAGRETTGPPPAASVVLENGWMASSVGHPVLREALLRVLHALDMDVGEALVGAASVPSTWARSGWVYSAPTVHECLTAAVYRGVSRDHSGRPQAGRSRTTVVVSRHRWSAFFRFHSDGMWSRLPAMPGPWGRMQRAMLCKDYARARWWGFLGLVAIVLVVWLCVWLWRYMQPKQVVSGVWGNVKHAANKHFYEGMVDSGVRAARSWWWPW